MIEVKVAMTVRKGILDMFLEGKKVYEGRVKKDPYDKIKAGDYVLIAEEGTRCRFIIARVPEVREYPTLEDMIENHWKELWPPANSKEEVNKVYEGIYGDLNLPALAIKIEPEIYFEGFLEKHWKKLVES